MCIENATCQDTAVITVKRRGPGNQHGLLVFHGPRPMRRLRCCDTNPSVAGAIRLRCRGRKYETPAQQGPQWRRLHGPRGAQAPFPQEYLSHGVHAIYQPPQY